MFKISPFLAISVVDGLGLVLGGADTATKQISLFNMKLESRLISYIYFAQN